jgi:RNA 2',3'-cyclic 3'-phosphodiesterase
LRLFVALPLPDKTRAALASWMERCGAQPGLRWTPRDQLHITLHFLGEVLEERASAVADALDATNAPEFRVALDRVEVLGRAGVLVALATQSLPFDALAQAVRSRLSGFSGKSESDRAFRPHVTLARARRSAAVPKAHLLPPLPKLEFPATCFRLYRSELKNDGAVHTVMREWRLD